MSMIINGSTCDGFYFPLSTLEKPTMLSLDSYSAYPEVAKSWDQLQVGNKCCGVHNYSDWFGLSLLGHFYDSYKLESPNGVPDSCCKQLTVGCGRNVTITNLENIYPTGCLKSLGVHIKKQIFEWIFKWLWGCIVVVLIHTNKDHRFRREYGSLLAFIDMISRAHDWMAKRAIIASNGKDKRRSYNRNNDIENTPLIEESVSDDHEINVEGGGVDTGGLITIRDNEEMNTTVIKGVQWELLSFIQQMFTEMRVQIQMTTLCETPLTSHAAVLQKYYIYMLGHSFALG